MFLPIMVPPNSPHLESVQLLMRLNRLKTSTVRTQKPSVRPIIVPLMLGQLGFKLALGGTKEYRGHLLVSFRFSMAPIEVESAWPG